MHGLSYSDARLPLCRHACVAPTVQGYVVFGIDLSARRMYCALFDVALNQGRMDGALFTNFYPTHSAWLVSARNAVIQPQCPSPTPRFVGESPRRAGTLGMVEPRERTRALFAAAPAAGTRSAITPSTIYGAGCAALFILRQSLADAASPALASSGRR